MDVRLEVSDPDLVLGVVIARGAHVGKTPPALAEALHAAVARRAGEEPPATAKEAVRALLRRGGYKPSGRGKPASEYLAQAAREGRFPFINNLVDANNLISLESGLPVSVLDADAFRGAAIVRLGRAGESYVFNAAGHSLDLAGLLVVCGADGAPLGTAVKDSMAGKVTESTRAVLGVIWGARAAAPPTEMAAHARRFGELLRDFAGATSVETRVVAG